MNSIEVLIVDDHMISVLGTKAMLKSSGNIIIADYITDPDDIILKLKEINVDVILLDLYMPRKGGFDVLKIIKKERPDIKVIMLSICEETDKLLQAFAYGADGYAFKDISNVELINLINKVNKGEPAFDPRVFEVLVPEFREYAKSKIHKKNGTSKLFNKEQLSKVLTERELKVLKLIGDKKTTIQISEDLGISKHTVATYRKNLYAKLKISRQSELMNLSKKLHNN